MGSNPFERFSYTPERPGNEPEVTEEGVVKGEIGSIEPVAEDGDSGLELLRRIEHEARKDAQLAEIFAAVGGADSRERASNALDRINDVRRELATSDVDPTFKRERDRWLSDIANRLRELL